MEPTQSPRKKRDGVHLRSREDGERPSPRPPASTGKQSGWEAERDAMGRRSDRITRIDVSGVKMTEDLGAEEQRQQQCLASPYASPPSNWVGPTIMRRRLGRALEVGGERWRVSRPATATACTTSIYVRRHVVTHTD